MKPRGPSKERVGERELSSQQCLKGSLSTKEIGRPMAMTRQTESRSTVWRRGEAGVEDAGQWKVTVPVTWLRHGSCITSLFYPATGNANSHAGGFFHFSDLHIDVYFSFLLSVVDVYYGMR